MRAESRKNPLLLKAEEIARLREIARRHQLNPRAVRHTRSLGDEVGLSQMGVHLVRVAPGAETTEFHFHHNEEEFIYILAGRGLAEIGKSRVEVGPGDFMGFPIHSPPHAMSNPFSEDLVYLLCGERRAVDVCDYPRRRRRRYRSTGKASRWSGVISRRGAGQGFKNPALAVNRSLFGLTPPGDLIERAPLQLKPDS